MSEVEKMYENAGVEPKIKCTSQACIVTNPHKNWCNKCESLDCDYPPFTAEKQIELIKWLIREKYLIGRYIESYYELFTNSMISYNSKNECFEKSLAGFINNLWQDLTEQERTEIKEILE